ncbi:unnamed protein product [Spirodela intermedia]|uniref:SNRNP25 ubiquitin-like domain-containing protein n=1 Tax=Spirodela intermedia TaxID=51605 RepID=A0A7I8JKI4_SPIIN|nr:unnamed protein product [Spirodela intermedia]CAA6670570.1 unnamed protein product [Spirodela intermedia]
MVDVGCRGVGAGFSRWSAFSYDRLPAQQLRLTIVKLDGSSFDVQVVKSASVTELKLAVEEIFSGSPRGGGGGISWSHVWGHFCLCYMNRKLTDNKASLKTFGIKDGIRYLRQIMPPLLACSTADHAYLYQILILTLLSNCTYEHLHFVRHVSINYNPIRQQPRKNGASSEQQRIFSGPPGLLLLLLLLLDLSDFFRRYFLSALSSSGSSSSGATSSKELTSPSLPSPISSSSSSAATMSRSS